MAACSQAVILEKRLLLESSLQVHGGPGCFGKCITTSHAHPLQLAGYPRALLQYSLSHDVKMGQCRVTGLNLVACLADQATSVKAVMTAPASGFLLLKTDCSGFLRVLVRVLVRATGCVVGSPSLQKGQGVSWVLLL